MKVPDLYKIAEELVCQIPAGSVSTFGDIASALGDTRAARWLGQYLRKSNLKAETPWYRIVRATGDLTLFADQQVLLKQEGIAIPDGKIALDEVRFQNFQSDYPLQQLSEQQKQQEAEIDISSNDPLPDIVAGLDVAYPQHKMAKAAYVEMEVASRKVLYSKTVTVPIHFPYISGYLAYRELPAHLQLLEEVQSERELASVLLVDGNGMLHPRKLGIATHLGLQIDHRTLGVSKKKLCGEVDLNDLPRCTPREVVYEGERLAYAFRYEEHHKPCFVSPGHRISLDQSYSLIEKLHFGHRLPEVIHLADRLSKST